MLPLHSFASFYTILRFIFLCVNFVFIFSMESAYAGPVVTQRLNVACNGYPCDLATVCRTTNFYEYDDGPNVCNDIGPRWKFASVPTEAAATALRDAGGLETMWVGGNDKTTENSFRWIYGRNANKIFSIGSTIQPGFWGVWQPLQPDNWSGAGPAGEDCLALQAVDMNDASCTEKYKCIGCERPRCSISLDCVEANTLSIEGNYWPDQCSCTCKKYFGGQRCQRPLTATLALPVTRTELLTSTQVVVDSLSLPVSASPITITQSSSMSQTSSRSGDLTNSRQVIATSSKHLSSTRTKSYSLSRTQSPPTVSSTRSLLSTSLTASLIVTTSNTMSTSTSASNRNRTVSASPIPSVTQTVSTTHSSSKLSSTQSSSLSSTVSISHKTASSASLSSSASLPQSESKSGILTLTEAVTRSCFDIPETMANYTCALLRPFKADFPAGCERIDLPFSYWGGKRGSTFIVSFIANGTFVTVENTIDLPMITGSFAPVSATTDPQNSTITVVVEYTGIDTLNSPGTFTLRFAPNVFRCPQPAPLVYTLVPIAAPKSSVATASETIQQIAGTLSLVMAMPAVAAQMGMLSGLQDLTRCEAADLTEELDFMNNPLGLGLGDEWGASQRGVFVGTIVIVLIFSTLIGLLAATKLGLTLLRGQRPNEPWPPTYGQQLQSMGAPGVYLLVAAFLMDSTVTAGVAMTLFGRSVGDRILGVVFTLIGYGYVVSIFWTTLRAKMTVEVSTNNDNETNESDNLSRLETEDGNNDEIVIEAKPHKASSSNGGGCLQRWFIASAEYTGNSIFQARYGTYIADLKKVRCYRGLELTAVCIVSSLQAAAFGTTISCVIELSIALIALVILMTVVVMQRPMSVLFEFTCTAFSLGAQIVTTLLMISNMFLQEPALEVAALICIMIGTLVTLIQAVQGMVMLLITSVRRISEVLRDWRRYRAEMEKQKLLDAKMNAETTSLLVQPLLVSEDHPLPILPVRSSSSSLSDNIDEDFVRLYTKGSMHSRGDEVNATLMAVESIVIDRELLGFADMTKRPKRGRDKQHKDYSEEQELREVVDKATAADAMRKLLAKEQARRYKERHRNLGHLLEGEISLGGVDTLDIESSSHNHLASNVSFSPELKSASTAVFEMFGPLTAALLEVDEGLEFSSRHPSLLAHNSNNNTSGAFADEEGPATIPTFV